MTNSPNAVVEYYDENQDEGHVNINQAYQRLENSPNVRIVENGTADPASLSFVDGVDDGKMVVVGTGAPSTEFFGHDGELAMFYAGWFFRPIKDGELVFNEDTGAFEWFDPAFSVWRGLNGGAIDFTQRDSGLVGYAGTPAPIQTKVLLVNGLPNNTTGSFPHGISGLTTDQTRTLRVIGMATDGTDSWPIPFTEATNRISFKITGTNVVVTTNFNASGWDATFTFWFE